MLIVVIQSHSGKIWSVAMVRILKFRSGAIYISDWFNDKLKKLAILHGKSFGVIRHTDSLKSPEYTPCKVFVSEESAFEDKKG